jgi:hypothetical protein
MSDAGFFLYSSWVWPKRRFPTARRLYGYDLAAAKDFVEELAAKQANKKSTV